jgi:Rrf2 family protein
VIAFTRKTDYAFIALASLVPEAGADAPKAGADSSAPVSARAIATRYSVPLPILMNVLKDLQGASLVRSTRGAKGGYALARHPRQITVHDVVEAIEGRPSLVMCCDGDEAEPCAPCAVELHCPVTHAVRRLNERVNLFLRQVTLADLLDGKALPPPVIPLSSLRQPLARGGETSPTRRAP